MGWVENASPEVEAISQYPTIIAVTIVVTLISIATVCGRLWIRTKTRGMALDDWFALLAMIFAIVYSILCIVQTKYGLGLPIKLRPQENLIVYTRVNFAGRPFYQLGISFFKVALLISYLRLFEGTNQRIYRRVVWVTIFLIFFAHVGCTLALIFACDPVDKSWNPLKEGKCLPPGPSFTGYAAVTIASDIIVALIPIPVLLKLNVSKGKKYGLIGVFLLGLFTTLCSILRYLEINRIQFGDGNSTMLVLWGVIEFNVGNITSSLPFLAPIFLRKAKEYRTKASAGYGSAGYGSSGSGNRRIGKGSELYKLSSVGKGTTGFNNGTSKNHSTSGSEEDILNRQQGPPESTIVKSVTYSVKVEDEERQMKTLYRE